MKKLLTMLLAMTVLAACTVNKPGTFEAGKNTFLLNGKPFVVKAAEVHYPRIPREYWEHRIEMCKALGMNTVCIYIFWNLHEQTPGNFDFTGNKDIAAFCRLAQKHGMYVIVRPGPYVCAEWEMGGLPWWLLKNDSVQLRTQDPFYMKHVGQFMHEVGRQLSGLTIQKGGPIIMVQVENEYGAYAADKPYISAIRDTVRAAGFNDVQLFQCDWTSTFEYNALPDLLWTMNFGTGANIEDQFSRLKQVRPDAPLMCSEFWSGWFDHWGRKHETRDGKVMVDGLHEMMEKGISFSLYMAHGGTTFGWWGGANNPSYSAMCSSYDYDAPISEAGWTTDKYFALRDMLKNYLDQGQTLPQIPEQIPVMDIPEIRFTEAAPLYANLPEPKHTEDIMPMEKFDQGWGSILYRTTLSHDVQAGTVLKITEQHDWTQVFADGRLLARLDRRKGQQEVTLPELKAGTQLDLLVEAMGRVNFDRSIHDRKGITKKVELVRNENAEPEELKGWTVYNFPLFYDFVSSLNYKDLTELGLKAGDIPAPAYYRAKFRLDKTADTFLNMESWGKGMVWVNGHALGRFWEIGPQQTLFMPGCWLKKGENEIIVLDMKGPRDLVVTGQTKPILDMLYIDEAETHRKEGQTISLENETPFITGTFKSGNGWQEIKSQTVEKGRFFCLEGLNAHDGSDVAAVAEIDVLDAEGNKIPRTDWKIVYADSEETRSGNRTADKLYDLQESTFWQTVAGTSYPHHVVIDMGKEYNISGLRILPRAEEGAPGMIKDYKVYVKAGNFTY